MYGDVNESVTIDETFHTKTMSPYGVSKVAAFEITKVYRRSYGMKIFNSIMFNHESKRRSKSFVTRKITNFVAAFKYGKAKLL
jgi:GDPmannose 4,6-dehydratase